MGFALRGWVRAAPHPPGMSLPTQNTSKVQGSSASPENPCRCLQPEGAGVVLLCFLPAIDTHHFLWMAADHRTDIFTAQSVTTPTFQIVTLGTHCFTNRVKIGFPPCALFYIYVHLNFIFFITQSLPSSLLPFVLYVLANDFPCKDLTTCSRAASFLQEPLLRDLAKYLWESRWMILWVHLAHKPPNSFNKFQVYS